MLTAHAIPASYSRMSKEQAFKTILREWRNSKGLLQKNAADLLKVSVDTYRHWECGANEPSEFPSKAEILKRMEAEQ
jgi:transcriptional regulator with XRE-family HTH domain